MTRKRWKWIGGLAFMGLLLASAPVAEAKDAPNPKDPPKKWRDYIFEDIKAPTPRPKSAPTQTPSRLYGSPAPAAKDAPKPKDPPGKWLPYIHEDFKGPTIPPKKQTGAHPSRLFGPRSPAAKDASKPKVPRDLWPRDILDFKPPTGPPLPKPVPQTGFPRLRSMPAPPSVPAFGPTPRQVRPTPSSALPSRSLPPTRPPYVHPPRRDFKGGKGPLR